MSDFRLTERTRPRENAAVALVADDAPVLRALAICLERPQLVSVLTRWTRRTARYELSQL